VYFYIKQGNYGKTKYFSNHSNDEWLKSQVDNQEYSSKSELINDLIRQARKQQAEINWLRTKLEKAEKGGFTSQNKEQILAEAQKLING